MIDSKTSYVKHIGHSPGVIKLQFLAQLRDNTFASDNWYDIDCLQQTLRLVSIDKHIKLDQQQCIHLGQSAVKLLLKPYSARLLTNMLYGLRAAGMHATHFDDSTRPALLAVIEKQIKALSAIQLCRMLGSLSTMQFKTTDLSVSLQHKLLAELTSQCRLFNAKNAAAVLRALNQIGWKWRILPAVLQRGLLEAMHRDLGSMDTQQIVIILQSLSQMGFQWDETLPQLGLGLPVIVESKVEDLALQEILSLLKSLDLIGWAWNHLSSALQQALLLGIENTIVTLTLQDTADTFLALARMNAPCPDGLIEKVTMAITETDSEDYAMSLHQFALAALYFKHSAEPKSHRLTEWLMILPAELLQATATDMPLSLNHNIVANCLHQLIREQYHDAILNKAPNIEGLIAADFLLLYQGRTIIIDVAAPTQDAPNSVLYAKDHKRNRLLEKLGYDVVQISNQAIKCNDQAGILTIIASQIEDKVTAADAIGQAAPAVDFQFSIGANVFVPQEVQPHKPPATVISYKEVMKGNP